MKEMLVAYKGGKCSRCGYSKCVNALEFHHRDRAQKDFNIAQTGKTPGLATLKHETDKCDLVCANCHREIHDELNAQQSQARKQIMPAFDA